ncbi:MAG: LLM class flavin-dependent oxidoreductase [Chitinophagales bacterium]|nr:LLM class flavin-dependent oxidoreductase [Chitinophagales bacterium]
MIPYSFLDLAIVSEGLSITQTLENSVKTAQLADKMQYTRYWFAEHHNMKSVASSATSVLIGHIVAKTTNIRVGSGGIMLPNHSPLVIAEHFGTLASLFPNRIDLGLGRAPGTDQLTAAALNPNFFQNARNFPENVSKLQQYFSNNNENAQVRAFPGEGVDVPIWILGSSTDSAFLASSMGLPYAFASHFAPAQMQAAFDIYTSNFNKKINKPYKMACVNVIIAETQNKAEQIATSFYQMFLGMIRSKRGYLQAPIPTMEGIWSPQEKAHVKQMTACSFIGTAASVKSEITEFIRHFDIDEVIITSPIYDVKDKLYTIQTFAELMNEK